MDNIKEVEKLSMLFKNELLNFDINNFDESENFCEEFKFKIMDFFNENKNTLEWGILKMIESPYTHIYKYVRNNTNFIDTEFNENIYINQLIELFC